MSQHADGGISFGQRATAFKDLEEDGYVVY